MLYLVDIETAKTLSYITIAIIALIPVVVYIIYQNGVKRRKRREGGGA